jgi:hypothetical protein
VTDVMTERPTELLRMDLVGPARVRSVGEKWYVLVVVDDYLAMPGCFSWKTRVRHLVLFEIRL